MILKPFRGQISLVNSLRYYLKLLDQMGSEQNKEQWGSEQNQDKTLMNFRYKLFF